MWTLASSPGPTLKIGKEAWCHLRKFPYVPSKHIMQLVLIITFQCHRLVMFVTCKCSKECYNWQLIGSGQIWFLYSKRRLLTQHMQESLQVTPGPFPIFGQGLGTRLCEHCSKGPPLYSCVFNTALGDLSQPHTQQEMLGVRIRLA